MNSRREHYLNLISANKKTPAGLQPAEVVNRNTNHQESETTIMSVSTVIDATSTPTAGACSAGYDWCGGTTCVPREDDWDTTALWHRTTRTFFAGQLNVEISLDFDGVEPYLFIDSNKEWIVPQQGVDGLVDGARHMAEAMPDISSLLERIRHSLATRPCEVTC